MCHVTYKCIKVVLVSCLVCQTSSFSSSSSSRHRKIRRANRRSDAARTFLTATTKEKANDGATLSQREDNKLSDSSFQQDSSAAEDTLFGFPRESVATPLSLLLLSQFLLFIGVGAVIPSIPLYGKEIGLSSAGNGVVISAPAVALLLLAKWGGNRADIARKPAMMLGMAVIALSDIGTALANGIATLVVARLSLGAGRCLSEAGERGMLADLAGRAPALRGRALAAQQASVALGIAIGAPLGGLVVEEYGPRAAFLCVSGAALVTLVLYSFLPETIESVKHQSKKDELAGTVDEKTVLMESEMMAPAEVVDETALSISQGDWAKLLSLREWRGLALCQCGASFGFAAKIASIPVLAADTLPGGAIGAGALLSAAGLSGIVGAPVGGWLTDRTNSKSTAILSGIVSAVGLTLVPFALGLSSTSETDSFVLGMSLPAAAFSAVVICWSLGASAQGPALTALAQELAPPGAEATAMALPRATGDGTYIIAPFLLGLITDSVVDIPGIECAFAGGASLLGILALALLGPGKYNKES